MSQKKVAIILADGFEDLEATVTMDVLTRLGVKVTAVGLSGREVKAANKIVLLTDTVLNKVDFSQMDCIILPGGMEGMRNLKGSARLREELVNFYNAGKLLAAICAGPIVLSEAGLLAGKDFTGYPGLESYYAADKPNGKFTCCSQRIVTGLGPGATFAFAAEIARQLGLAAEVAHLYEKGMFVKL
ncbi:MAG: DJ-1/PfpI family protein [Victivallaceae bacterium]